MKSQKTMAASKPKTQHKPLLAVQHMAPPAPRVQERALPVVVPPHIEVKRITLELSRFENGRRSLWD